jgi:hypothetical protein
MEDSLFRSTWPALSFVDAIDMDLYSSFPLHHTLQHLSIPPDSEP